MRDVPAIFGALRRGQQWIARCPAHPDRKPSLSIAQKPDGGWLVHCHAGCETPDVVAKVGLTMADLYDAPRMAASSTVQVAWYDYPDRDGTLRFQKVRLEPKSFFLRRPNGSGGWILGIGDAPRVLYRLPELYGREEIFLPEGERDADTLWSNGLAASTNFEGAGKWRDEYAEQLLWAGVKRVNVVPDNDAPGLQHAELVAAACAAAGLDVRVIVLRGLPAHGDVTDWFTQGGTAERLCLLSDGTAPWQPSHATDTGAEPRPDTRPPTSRAKIICLNDVKPEVIDWVWESRLARGKITLLIGDGGEGKSTLSLAIASVLSRGGPWPDGGNAPVGTSILLTVEDGLADTIRPRLDALGAACDRIVALAMVEEVNGADRMFSLARDIGVLERAIQETGALLVVLDPITAYLGTGTDSYKDAAIRGVLTPLVELAERLGVAIVAIMHIGKGTDRKAAHRALGSVGFTNLARIVLAVGRDPDCDDRRLVLPVKQNICAPAAPLAFVLDPASGLRWDAAPIGPVSAERMLAHRPGDDGDRDAEEWLRDFLDKGPQPACDVLKQGRAAGLTDYAIREAKKRLRVDSRKGGYQGEWLWFPPKMAPDEAKMPTV